MHTTYQAQVRSMKNSFAQYLLSKSTWATTLW